jgi:hypothetical protein
LGLFLRGLPNLNVPSGSQATHHDHAARRPLKARKLTSVTTPLAYAVRNTCVGGCDGRISANAT